MRKLFYLFTLSFISLFCVIACEVTENVDPNEKKSNKQSKKDTVRLLESNETIGGITYKAYTAIKIYWNGKVKEGTLLNNASINSITYKGETVIKFYESGKVSEGTLSADTSQKHITYAGNTKLMLDGSGNVTVGTISLINYDYDDDNLIEIRCLEQLDGIRYDTDGNGEADDKANHNDTYRSIFPHMASSEVGTYEGYELTKSLDFQNDNDYKYISNKAGWTTGVGFKSLLSKVIKDDNPTYSNFFGDV